MQPEVGRARVLMFNPQFAPLVGGAERQTELLASVLTERGALVEVLTLRLDPSWPVREKLPSGVVVHRVTYADVSRRWPRLRARGQFDFLLLSLRLNRVVRTLSKRFDVLHAHNASTPTTALAVRAARRHGLRTMAKTVSIGRWFDLNKLEEYGYRGRLAQRWLRRDVDRWVAVSGAVQDELVAAGIPGDRIVRVANSVLLPEASRTMPDRATHFLYLGRLARTAPRDVEGLLQAFEVAARDAPATELAIVGGGDRLDEIRRLAASSAVATKVQLPGFEDGEKWRRWAHVLVQPSFVEGMSNSLLEAMADGIACVAYDIPPNREALGEGGAGILVPTGDRAALAEAIKALATEPGLARDLGAKARRRAEETYDVNRIAGQLESTYHALSSHRRHSE